MVFSPRGRTPALWGLITRRDRPSTRLSKAQVLTSPPLAATSSTDFRAQPSESPGPAKSGHLAFWTQLVGGAILTRTPSSPVHFSPHKLWDLCWVKRGCSWQVMSLEIPTAASFWNGASGLPAAFAGGLAIDRDFREEQTKPLYCLRGGRRVGFSQTAGLQPQAWQRGAHMVSVSFAVVCFGSGRELLLLIFFF